MPRRPYTLLTATVVALLTLLGVASPAAAVTTEQKLAVLYEWTQTSAGSYGAWNATRLDRARWSEYAFDWSTDYCTTSPDNPFGFPFALACARHDFGYRNYRRAGADAFTAAKSRLDDAFHADLRRVCARYAGAKRVSCEGTAWTYYQAVRTLGAAGSAAARPA